MAAYRSSSLLSARLRRVGAEQHQTYMPADAGPFTCSRCVWYPRDARCNEPHILLLAHRGMFGLRFDGELAIVDPDGCSDFFFPKKDVGE